MRFIGDALASGHPVTPDMRDAVLLVASELVTNAVRHTDGPCCLDVSWAGDGIDVDVTDSSPQPPRLRTADPAGATGGYGWPLVRRLASEVDVHLTSGSGKTIHAHVPGVAP
ncbi:ATP-binding protein [Streptomyces sp. BR123]|nr:ATP-binding protein [Streptomyces sp. BR123]